MEQVVLRKIQFELLDILKEIERVCNENGIHYFLDAGTLIGAVRHKGFIPWDDDIDVGMLREEYDKFAELAPAKLGEEYVWQDWKNDRNYGLPFGKVRKKNTVYLEEKAGKTENDGFYVDVFPFDNAPDGGKEKDKFMRKRICLLRRILMKDGYKPWIENGHINIKKRCGYLYYQILALPVSKEEMVDAYEKMVRRVPESYDVYEQFTDMNVHYHKREWISETVDGEFEKELFPVPIGTDAFLTSEYGNYMQLPPENERANRHGIYKIVFSDNSVYPE